MGKKRLSYPQTLNKDGRCSEMGYVIAFFVGAIFGFLLSACCLVAGRDDDQNGRER